MNFIELISSYTDSYQKLIHLNLSWIWWIRATIIYFQFFQSEILTFIVMKMDELYRVENSKTPTVALTASRRSLFPKN